MPAENSYTGKNGVSPTLHGLVEAQVSRTPEATAVVFEDESLTYAELDSRAAELARELRGRGVGATDLVAVALDKSLGLVVSILAVLKAGAAYLPVDTSYPAGRIAFMLEDAHPACVLADSVLATRLRGRCMIVDPGQKAPPAPAARRSEPPIWAVHADEAAYVIYTSGSTGRPKGVVVSHRSIVNRLTWVLEEYEVTPDDRVLQKAPTGFDGAVVEFFMPLCAGAAIVLAKPGGHREPEYLAELIAKRAVTIAQFVPSMLPAFLDDELAPLCKTLRRVYSAGDVLSIGVQQRFRRRLDADLVNTYGPTEATIDVSHWSCVPEPGATSVPVGNAARNTRIEVLDAELRRVPALKAGEIYLAGVQLARGYFGRPGMTAERFVADPHGAPGERMYRTGDRGRKRPDGVLEFIGRADAQVKIRGVRVEPAEVEAALARHPSVVQSAVKAVPGASGDKRLIAQVVVADRSTITSGAIRDYLRSSLPEAMVPSAIVFRGELPLTPNGKLDRAALPTPCLDDHVAQADGADELSADDVENSLLGLVREVLGVRHATLTETFIGLGGDSISAIRLASRARQAGLRVSTGDVLRHNSLGDLARITRRVSRTAESAASDGVGRFPLTPIMRRLFELGGQVNSFSQSMVLRTPADAQEPELLTCLQALLDSHDVLRARFKSDSSGARQPEISEVGAVTAASCLETVDVADIEERHLPPLVRAGLDRARSQLDIAAPKLLRALWFRGGPSRQGRLAVLVNHLVVDGVSLRILRADLAEAWKSLRLTGTPRVAPVPLSFRRWASLLDQESSSIRRRRELEHWIGASTGPSAPVAEHATGRRPSVTATLSSRRLDLSAETTESLLNQAPSAFGSDVNTLLLTGLALALAAWQDPVAPMINREFRIAMEGHGREEVFPGADPVRTVGWFTSLFPVRLRLDGIETQPGGPSESALRRAVDQIGRQLAAIPDKGFGYGLLRYQNPETAPRLTATEEPGVLFNYLGRFSEADRSDWAFDADHDVAMDESDDSMPSVHAVEVNSLAMRQDDGLVLSAVWKWDDSLLGGESVGRLAALWFAMLARIADYAGEANANTPVHAKVSQAVAARGNIEDIESEFREF
ncbi:amino acid adenylation domain-containing protein [Amycolatopsis sp. NPDC054798]